MRHPSVSGLTVSIRSLVATEPSRLPELKRVEEIFARLIASAESNGLRKRRYSSELQESNREGSSAGSEDGIDLQAIKQLPAREESNSSIIGTEENPG